MKVTASQLDDMIADMGTDHARYFLLSSAYLPSADMVNIEWSNPLPMSLTHGRTHLTSVLNSKPFFREREKEKWGRRLLSANLHIVHRFHIPHYLCVNHGSGSGGPYLQNVVFFGLISVFICINLAYHDTPLLLGMHAPFIYSLIVPEIRDWVAVGYVLSWCSLVL